MDDSLKSADSNCHRSHREADSSKRRQTPPDPAAVREESLYSKKDKPVPDNSPFFETRSNPLSSKGN